jgi:hypothetical protein
MASKREDELAKANRLRLTAPQGDKMIEEAAAKVTAVRANMERLRALRLAQEAQAVRPEVAKQQATKPKKRPK